MIKIVAVHTAMALVEPIGKLFKEHFPEAKVNHIADDSLIQEVIANNAVTPAVRRRLLAYYNAAADSGADLVFNTCSSVGGVAEIGNIVAPIPVLRIDNAMAAEAVRRGGRIGVIATLNTTLDPTAALLEAKAAEAGAKIKIVRGLADGAFQAGQSGDPETHDRLIRQAAERIASQVDLFVLAQGSMARMEERLAEVTGKPVLSSPKLGVLEVRDIFAKAGKK